MRGRHHLVEIPDEFDILGYRILVKKVPNVYEIPDKSVQEENTLGAYLDQYKTIYLVTNSSSEESLKHVFFHEFGHCIMAHIGREDLDEDEGFLDSLGACFHQYLKTFKKARKDSNA